jgi:hypothetical protein
VWIDELTIVAVPKGLLALGSKTGGRGDPEDDRFLGAGILKPMLLFRRQVETLSCLEFEHFFPKSKGHPSSKHVSEFLSFMRPFFGRDLSLP